MRYIWIHYCYYTTFNFLNLFARFFFIEAAMGIQVNAQLEDSEYLNAVQKYTFSKTF